MPVRAVALGRYGDSAYQGLRGRLVWIVSFGEADRLGPVPISGSIGTDHSCDWAWHYVYWVVSVDAETGEFVTASNGALFDPSLPPTYDSPDNSDREYCEKSGERDLEQARGSP